MTQNAKVINHLLQGRSITSLEAMNKYGIMALHSRASDIREIIQPYQLSSIMVHVPTRDGQARVCRYSFNLLDIEHIKELPQVKKLIEAA